MSVQNQWGVMTLLMTSILLIAALALTLGSYKTTFFQIKTVQNEIKSRQAYWLAEGGLECAYHMIRVDQDRTTLTLERSPAYFSQRCTLPLQLSAMSAKQNSSLGDNVYQLYAVVNYTQLTRAVIFDDSAVIDDDRVQISAVQWHKGSWYAN